MLRSLKFLQGYVIEAIDGQMGKVSDFYFDDQEWIIRYLIVDTGTWLPGRQVLISPYSLGKPEWNTQLLPVDLTKAQVEQSPEVTTDKPVSLQKESELARYYHWPPYWGGIDPLFPAPMGMEPLPITEEIQAALEKREEEAQKHANPHLRSVREVIGYAIQANNGKVGQVVDFIADINDWPIRYIVIDTQKWLPGGKVLAPPSCIKNITWADRQLKVDVTYEQIQHFPKFDPSFPINREFELKVFDFYGRPPYWN